MKTKKRPTKKPSRMDKYRQKLKNRLQTAGGYSFDVGSYIAGHPEVVSYNDCAPPVILNHKLVSSGCKSGCGVMGRGGAGRRRRKTQKKHKKSTRSTRRRGRQKGGMGPFPFEGKLSNYDSDMNNRKFGCRQPSWDPDCV